MGQPVGYKARKARIWRVSTEPRLRLGSVFMGISATTGRAGFAPGAISFQFALPKRRF
jgi:hypothetical protein